MVAFTLILEFESLRGQHFGDQIRLIRLPRLTVRYFALLQNKAVFNVVLVKDCTCISEWAQPISFENECRDARNPTPSKGSLVGVPLAQLDIVWCRG